ncbi:TniB family NTP-binding protein [Streptomyces sp. NPDC002285]
MRTPAMDGVFTAVRRLLLVNRSQQAGARRGLIISGPATTGKTTMMMALWCSFQLADARRHTGQAVGRPVLFISVPPAATPKMLVSEFARFLGMPVTDRLNQTQITGAVCDLLCEPGTQLVLIDDVHLLDTQRRAGAETSDQLKYLGERIPATFVYSAIDIETSSLLSGVRGAADRWPFQALAPPAAGVCHRAGPGCLGRPRAGHGDAAEAAVCAPARNPGQARRPPPRPHRRETLLRQLCAHRPGTLVKHAARLHARTAGRIGSLSRLIHEAALVAVTEGTERITKQLLGEVELDAAAEAQARPARTTRRKEHPAWHTGAALPHPAACPVTGVPEGKAAASDTVVPAIGCGAAGRVAPLRGEG